MMQYLKDIKLYNTKDKPDMIWHVGDLAYNLYEQNGTRVS